MYCVPRYIVLFLFLLDKQFAESRYWGRPARLVVTRGLKPKVLFRPGARGYIIVDNCRLGGLLKGREEDGSRPSLYLGLYS